MQVFFVCCVCPRTSTTLVWSLRPKRATNCCRAIPLFRQKNLRRLLMQVDVRSVISTKERSARSASESKRPLRSVVVQTTKDARLCTYSEQTFHCLTSRRFAQVSCRRRGKAAQHKGTLSKRKQAEEVKSPKAAPEQASACRSASARVLRSCKVCFCAVQKSGLGCVLRAGALRYGKCS